MCNTCGHHKSRSFLVKSPLLKKCNYFTYYLTDPVLPGLFYKHLCHSFSTKSSKHHKSQAIRARDLKILHNVHHLSRVTCQVSQDIFLYIFFGQTGGFSCLRVCYPWGIPHLVLVHVENITTGLSYRNKSLSSPPPLSGLIMWSSCCYYEKRN